MRDAPVLVLACNEGPQPGEWAVAVMGNVIPATWSFMLAAPARALGTTWTSMHLARERDVADILGLDYETLAQAVLIPMAYTKGTDFPLPHAPPRTRSSAGSKACFVGDHLADLAARAHFNADGLCATS